MNERSGKTSLYLGMIGRYQKMSWEGTDTVEIVFQRNDDCESYERESVFFHEKDIRPGSSIMTEIRKYYDAHGSMLYFFRSVAFMCTTYPNDPWNHRRRIFDVCFKEELDPEFIMKNLNEEQRNMSGTKELFEELKKQSGMS